MIDISTLRDGYLLRDTDPSFAVGRRANLVYAVESLSAGLNKVNSRGPDPLDYLEYAKRDLTTPDTRGAINALGNAKRAIHLSIDALLKLWGLTDFARANFPARLELLNQLGAFPTRMILALNEERNLTEHEYIQIEIKRAEELVELCELFLAVIYPYLKHTVIGCFVGTHETNQCEEWFINHSKKAVIVRDVPTDSSVKLPIGNIHCNIRRPKDVLPKATIPITKSNMAVWLPYLDLFAYYTKHSVLRVPKTNEGGKNMCYAAHESTFLDESEIEPK